MISYRQADLINRIRKYNTYKVIFVYDEADKFHFFSFDHVEGNTDESVESRSWHAVRAMMPRLIEQEQVYLHPMNLENARILIGYIVNSMNKEGQVISAKQIGEEVVADINKYGTRKDVYRFLVEVTL